MHRSARFDGTDPERQDLVVALETEEVEVTLVSLAGQVHLVTHPVDDQHVRLSGPVDATVGLLLGRIDEATAVELGVAVDGDAELLAGLRPRGERHTAQLAPSA